MYMLFVVMLAVFVAAPPAQGISNEGPHSFKRKECLQCHFTIPREKEKRPFTLVAPVSNLCRKCHKSAMRTFSHPVDVVPKNVTIPSELPLTDDGRLTCNTCHDMHSEYRNPDGTTTYFLRHRIADGNFCTLCHDAREVSHTTMLTAHLRRALLAKVRKKGLDEASNMCLACHDGMASVRGIEKKSLPGERQCFCSAADSHPVGMDYQASFRSRGKLRRMEELDESLRLVQGKVSCITCHDPYSKNSKLLVMSNEDSRLCLSCHVK